MAGRSVRSAVLGSVVALFLTGCMVAEPTPPELMPVATMPPAPPVRVEVAPPQPAPAYVWVPGHWAWRHPGYVWMPGYWAVPEQPGYVWVPGYWIAQPGGYLWVEGRWRAR